jgi:hypothetical protein
MKWSKPIIAALLILAVWFIPTSTLAANKTYTKKTYKGIHFLDDVNKVAWYKVQGKHIVIGWKGIPEDFYGWNHRTAVRASKLNKKHVHVWAVRHHQRDWSPGEGGQICVTTALRGRLDKTNCRK